MALRGSRKEIVVSLLYREALAIPLQYFPSVTPWNLQGMSKRARIFRVSEGAVGWAETHLSKTWGETQDVGEWGRNN